MLPAVEARAQDLASDKAALEALYNATGGANWTDNTNWLSSEPVGDWHGVTVSNGRVTRLDLSYNQLTGAIPASPLVNLANLEELFLNNNQLTGSIPAQLGNLASLEELNLSNNQLTGSIPAQLGNLANLRVLYLSNNQLTGAIPAELGNLTNLRGLWLHGNQLTGSIPSQVGNLANLVSLQLQDNRLTGPLPQSLTNLENLESLSFNNGTTGLCAPADTAFQNWLEAIDNTDDGPTCSADNYSIPGKTTLTYPKVGSFLDDLIARVAAGEISAQDAAAEAPLHRGDAVAVTIYLSGNVNGVVSFLQTNNVTPRNQGDDYIEAFVPVRLLGTVSQQTGVLHVQPILLPPPPQVGPQQQIGGNGPAVHGSLGWNEAGITGQGIKVGIIDNGFVGFSGLMGTELPGMATARCYRTGTDLPTEKLKDCETETVHGTATAETIIDIAPEASLYIANAWTRGDTEDAVEWMINNGVEVINGSIRRFFDGPGDGTSPYSDSPLNVLDRAVNAGIVWINSAGNDARTTWYGTPTDTDGDGFLEFSGGKEEITVRFAESPWSKSVQLRWEGKWGGEIRDLDLYIYDSNGRVVKESSHAQSGESWHRADELVFLPAGTYKVRVVTRTNDLPGWIQLLSMLGSYDPYTESGSMTSPAESANPGMLAVGAASWSKPDTIEWYSSRGPAPDGRIKPDVVGAACGETATYSTPYCGTSQASPHVAGMAALVRQRFPQSTPAQVAAYLKDNAEQRVSSPDPNNTWGHGFAVLPPLSPHAISCAQAVPDSANNRGLVQDCETLLSARDQLRGNASLNWSGGNPIAMWQGIGLGGSPQRVTRLDLDNIGLTGTIPAELDDLANLQYLNLSNNRMTGAIPSELGNLANLQELYLGGRYQFTGAIPPELGNLVNLRRLSLSITQLKGTIPAELGKLTNLRDLFLSRNQLTGTIPAELGKLTKLRYLYLHTNQLTGTIPAELGALGSLNYLDLYNNQLSGTIPAQLGNLANLLGLGLSNNQLTGTIPQSFTRLGRLNSFSFNLNHGLCAQDTGPVRTWLNGVTAVRGPACTPTVRLSANPSRLFEGAGATPVTVTAEQTAVSSPTTVDLRLGGSAEQEMGRDYTLSGSLSITIPANTTSGTTMLTFTPLDDGLAEGDENIIIEAFVSINQTQEVEGSAILTLSDAGTPLPCAARDRAALEALYNATGGANWSDNTNWLSSQPLSDWHGVTADDNGCVRGLDLSDNQLTGTIPAELGNLANLEELSLYDNQLTGTIPAELGNLANLQGLFLRRNQLTGGIPAELGDLANLQWLLLEANQLTGTIPASLGNLANLDRLGLSQNQLTGTIPATLGNLTNLRLWLDLSNNQLTGTIPTELGKLTNLRALFLSRSQLTGPIPAELGNLASIERLYLHNNQLTGTIPASFGNLAKLETLYLHGNQLTGTIPDGFTNLGALQRFYFYLNPGLCAQDSGGIRTWLNGVSDVRGPDCTPTVRLSANPSHLIEGAGATPVTVTAERAAASSATTVDLRLGGSAEQEMGRDYTLTGSLSITIPANTTSGATMLTFTPLADNLPEDNENIIVEAVVGGKTEGSVTLPLIDMAGACAARDRAALEALYNATGGPDWTNNTNWLSDRPLSEWHGITVDSNGCVTELNLPNNQLTGSIPSELGNLANLQRLNLSSNQLTGTIPTSFTHLGALIEFNFNLNPGLCAQHDVAIGTWLNGIADVQGPDCSAAQYDETAKRFHFLPHIADGDGWQSTLLVTNVAQSASACRLQLYGLGVNRFERLSSVQTSGSTATFNLPGAGAYLTWPTRNRSTLASGYATLDCTEPVVAQVVFASIGSSGKPTGMATVFSSQAGRVFQLPVLTPEATLGFAIANDTTAFAACRILLEDPQRRHMGEASLSVPSKSNWSGRLLNRLISIPSTFRDGTATVSCTQPVAMVGLHFETQPNGGIITFSTLPPAVVVPSSQSSDETAKRFHFLPHIADGNGWQSTLLVTNVEQSASACRLQLHGLGVNRFEHLGTVQASGSTATFNLPGAGAYLTWPTRNRSTLASGYATLDCTEPVVAQVVFASIGSSGRPTGMATVFSSQAGRVFQLPVLTPEATLGFAIANDTTVFAACRIVLEDPQRRHMGEASLSVPSKSNWSGRLLDQLISIPSSFRGGTATVSCDEPVAMIGLHFELRSNRTIITFNTLPPAVIESIPSSQSAALEAPYHGMGGTSWNNRTNWLSPVPLREWLGLGTDGNGRVTSLEFKRNLLSGRGRGKEWDVVE